MNGEAFVGVILQASLVAVGLLMAIFGIILPSIKNILEYRISSYYKLVKDLEKNVGDFKESPKNFDVYKINDSINKIDTYKRPLPFTKYQVLIATLLYIFTVLLCIYWFFITSEGNLSEYLLGIIGGLFCPLHVHIWNNSFPDNKNDF